jgi:flagellar basal-body rod modification protein FlgD
MSMIDGVNNYGNLGLPVSKADTVGKDDFLEMMIAQLKNQDPLNPLDGTDFTAQLAQFSSLEQLVNMNEQLQSISLYQSSLNNAGALNLIGREITAQGDTIKVEGSSVDLMYNLSGNAQEVTIRVYDEGGNLVNTLEPGSQNKGKNAIAWDCSGMASGNYTFEVSAVNAAGEVIPAYTIITGKVEGVTFKEGSPYLSVNDQDIPFEDIISVHEAAV